jgi:hypothetical protein
MAIPFLNEIEKLITEQGSAAILKECIALLGDKYTSLEQQLNGANLRIQQLESENEALKFENTELKEQRWTLEEQLSDKRKKEFEEACKLAHSLEPTLGY